MSRDLVKSFAEAVTKISATPEYPVGAKRFEGGKKYIYQQADDALTVGQAVILDFTASAYGLKVAPSAAATDHVYGVAEVAVTDEYYFWATVGGQVTASVATGVTAGDPLIATSAAGIIGKDGAAAANRCAIAMESNSSGGPLAKKVFLFGIGA